MNRCLLSIATIFLLLSALSAAVPKGLSPYRSHYLEGRSIIIDCRDGERLRITSYGEGTVRLQAVRADEEFFPDDRYEMVVSHAADDFFSVRDESASLVLSLSPANGLELRIQKDPLRCSFAIEGSDSVLLSEAEGSSWNADTVTVSFQNDPTEHFTGLGHGFFGRVPHIDLRGETISRSYGTKHGQQAPLIVPFYLSSKGYGIFVNSMMPNRFEFGDGGRYRFSLFGGGQIDYFFILGPDFRTLLDRYTLLTGRPRFPPKAAFGLGLSDKVNDHTSPHPSDEEWWKEKVRQHRAAGFPIDHIINDNRWRAGGGQRCESYFDWDRERYPDPSEYQRWVKKHGLFVTLDFNRCIASQSEGWKPEYTIPEARSIDFSDSAPDLTKPEVRRWWWNLLWNKSLDPHLNFPGDALWIDEFDEMGRTDSAAVLGNGRTWREMRNYWFFLVAKALVQEGWDPFFNDTKRPFVWVRGMTAGAQRYATLWSGDIDETYSEMALQVRGMQMAGLSGFPFWGHDAGGFHSADTVPGPDETMYRQWSLALGSFTPFWKPHGVGVSRWPLDRSPAAQRDAHTYLSLHYGLMPYTYTAAHQAAVTGLPIARAMVIDYRDDERAWTYDLQYLWGDDILVAPNCSDSDDVTVWLPRGPWYDLWTDSVYNGNSVVHCPSPIGELPLFVRAGSVIPMAGPARGTAFIRNDSLTVHIYAGADGAFELYEDDGTTERYRSHNEYMTTIISYRDAAGSISIAPSKGTYRGAPTQRAYTIVIHGAEPGKTYMVNGAPVKATVSSTASLAPTHHADSDRISVTVFRIPSTPVTEGISITSSRR